MTSQAVMSKQEAVAKAVEYLNAESINSTTMSLNVAAAQVWATLALSLPSGDNSPLPLSTTGRMV